MDKKLYDLSLRVLVYKEDELYHARCLEMDLVGTGNSEKVAVMALVEMVKEHISFAVFKRDDGLLMFRADKEYFDRWEKAHQSKLRNQFFPDTAISLDADAVCITLSKDELGRLKKLHRFNQVQEPALA